MAMNFDGLIERVILGLSISLEIQAVKSEKPLELVDFEMHQGYLIVFFEYEATVSFEQATVPSLRLYVLLFSDLFAGLHSEYKRKIDSFISN
jgi:hypothetical protein